MDKRPTLLSSSSVMHRFLPLATGLALFVLLGAPTSSVSQADAFSAARIELAAESASQEVASVRLPCEITIRAANSSAKAIAVDLSDSRVKTKSGLWETLEASGGDEVCARSVLGLAARSETEQVTCTLAPTCEEDRRYKFKMTYDGNIVWAYYPSANGWTMDTALDLGDVGRHFQGF